MTLYIVGIAIAVIAIGALIVIRKRDSGAQETRELAGVERSSPGDGAPASPLSSTSTVAAGGTSDLPSPESADREAAAGPTPTVRSSGGGIFGDFDDHRAGVIAAVEEFERRRLERDHVDDEPKPQPPAVEPPAELLLPDPDVGYAKIRAVSWSALKHLHTSALMYKWRIDHPEPSKPAFLLGGGIHCATLELDKFDERYALCNVTRNASHAKFQAWLEEHPGQKPLNHKEWDHVRGASDAVLKHRVARRVLEGCRREEPMTWVDPDTGLKCKARVDAICPDYLVELKSDRDPSPAKFARAAAEYLYHCQLSMYQTGAVALKKIDGKEMPYVIAVGKEPPYDVAVYRMVPDDLHAGRQVCLALMRRLVECITTDMWPGVAPDLQYLDLPPWAPGLRDTDYQEAW